MKQSSVVVKQVKPQVPLFDVFTKQGWEHWSRVAWDMKRKRLTLVKGERLTPLELKVVYDEVESLMHHLTKESSENN